MVQPSDDNEAPDPVVAPWREWLSVELEVKRDTYARDPALLVADSDRELEHARDYHGRELLELLQNVDDAAREGGPCDAVIDLRPEGLCVANRGEPFSRDGVKSLMLANYSPKRRRRAQFIGCKGLGFRSILTWSN